MSKKNAPRKNKNIHHGQVIIPAGHPNPPEPHEVTIAWILARHYDCTVEFLIPIDDYKRKTPDIVMQGLEWEIKSPTGKSKNTIECQMKRAAKQSGYMVFDGRRTPISDTDIENGLLSELKKRTSIKKLIFITKPSVVVEIEPRS
jgi:hypothetical protein